MNYNYLIMDGTKLFRILNNYNHHDLISKTITNEDFEHFKRSCIYAGKGTNDRKMSHLIFGKQILLKELVLRKINAKFSKITQIWERNDGIVILHLFTETNHYEAMSREYAMIKALGINNVTNEINGSQFGAMKNKWNYFEITNYGNMILYNALKMAINENPPLIFHSDIQKKRTISRKNGIEDFELEGILSCFLEL